MLVGHAELALQIVERLLRRRVVIEQRLAVLDDPSARILIGKPLPPLVHELLEFPLVAAALIVQAVEKIIILAAGTQLAKRLLAVRRQRKPLDETDLVFRPRRRRVTQTGGQRGCRNQGG